MQIVNSEIGLSFLSQPEDKKDLKNTKPSYFTQKNNSKDLKYQTIDLMDFEMLALYLHKTLKSSFEVYDSWVFGTQFPKYWNTLFVDKVSDLPKHINDDIESVR